VLLVEFIWVYKTWVTLPEMETRVAHPVPDATVISNTHAIGHVLYTEFVYLFQLSGLILLVAMIGAIVLTLRSRPGVRRQNVNAQINRDPKDVLKVEKITTGTGVS